MTNIIKKTYRKSKLKTKYTMQKVIKILKGSLLFVLGLVVLFSIVSTIYNHIGNCKVEGKIEGLGTRLAMVSGGTDSYNKTFLKLILVFNDRFNFKTNLKESGGGRIVTRNMLFKRANGKSLWMRSKIIEFEINPNETISVIGSIKDYSIDYRISGNKTSEQFSKFLNDNLPILEYETYLELKRDSLEYWGKGQKIIDSLNLIFNKTRENYNYQRLNYVIQNPTHEISATFLLSQDRDSIIKYFPTLSENAVDTYDGNILKERYATFKNFGIGKPAPIFSGLTIESKPFNLTDLKGKYVVIDFWGTWCAWCIKGFPKMQEYYDKHKNELEFVGIACHDRKELWEKFVKEKGLNWIQLLNDEINNDLIKKYGVESFPTRVLIDKEGNIAEIFLGESDDFYDRIDILLDK
jgi:thiol-disulfide isomerase/thioredoxin